MAFCHTVGASDHVGLLEEPSMLLCRRCRRCVLDSTCLNSASDDLTAVCTVWHVDHDALPDWIVTVIDQVHWTVGKLNCQHCGARLGGFNFLTCSKCPCGRDTSVHLSKSRVDSGSKRPARPRRPGVAAGRPGFKDGEPRADPTRAAPLLARVLTVEEPTETEPASEPAGHLESVERGPRESPRLTGTDVPRSEQGSGSALMMTKREKNHLKKLRRKQRKKERWMQRKREEEEEQDVDGALTGSDDDQKGGSTCAVCLDVYYKPYMCRPCGHVFCEPCLRTLAKNRSDRTPCPLCRTLVSHVVFQEELHRRVGARFPRDYRSRKKTFQNTDYSKWPLPDGPKHLHTSWGLRRAGAPGGRWRDGLDVRRWLDWTITVLVVSWVLLYFIV